MERTFSQYNTFMRANPSFLQKSLTTAAGVGNALIPEVLEKIITDTAIRLSPELALMTSKHDASDTHKFNRLTVRPQPGGAMGESATTPVSNAKYTRTSVQMKIIRRKGKVTNFLQDTSETYTDAGATEMQNHIQSHILDLIHYIYYGNDEKKSSVNSVLETKTDVEFNGWDRFIATNRTNEIRGGVTPSSLKTLDDMIDASHRKGSQIHNKTFLMTPEMLSLFSRLLTNVRLNQGLSGSGITTVNVNGGWRLNAYRDIPIIETTSTGPIEQMRPTIVLGTAASGGGFSNGTYYIQVAPLTYEGEQEASAEQNITLSGGGAAQTITITLSDIHKDANGNINCFGYKIYLSSTTLTETLVKIVSAYTYDTELAPDLAGNYNGTTGQAITLISTAADASVPTHMQNDLPLVASGGIRPEIIGLIDLDPIQGLGKLPYTNSPGSLFNGLIVTQPLAVTDDFIQFLTKTYAGMADSYEATSFWRRGLRVA